MRRKTHVYEFSGKIVFLQLLQVALNPSPTASFRLKEQYTHKIHEENTKLRADSMKISEKKLEMRIEAKHHQLFQLTR